MHTTRTYTKNIYYTLHIHMVDIYITHIYTHKYHTHTHRCKHVCEFKQNSHTGPTEEQTDVTSQSEYSFKNFYKISANLEEFPGHL